jgi:hypothetical protein
VRGRILFFIKKDRKKAIKDVVDDAIGEKGDWDVALTWANGIRPAGAWWYISIIQFLFLVLELKLSKGLAGDVTLQAALDYAKIVLHDIPRICHFGCRGLPLSTVQACLGVYCNFPTVLVGASANRLEISVAIYLRVQLSLA